MAWSLRRLRQGRQAWRQQTYLALDFELSDLDPRRGEILSIGLVEIAQGEIRLASTRYWTIKPRRQVGQSAVIHRLFDGHLQQAEPIETVYPRLSELLPGRILVAHNSAIELAFLAHCHQQLGQPSTPLMALDTLAIEHRRLLRSPDGIIKAGDLTLTGCRRRYRLPPHQHHHALHDAVGCAELFLAQATAMGSDAPLRLFKPRYCLLGSQ